MIKAIFIRIICICVFIYIDSYLSPTTYSSSFNFAVDTIDVKIENTWTWIVNIMDICWNNTPKQLLANQSTSVKICTEITKEDCYRNFQINKDWVDIWNYNQLNEKFILDQKTWEYSTWSIDFLSKEMRKEKYVYHFPLYIESIKYVYSDLVKIK